jgi:CHASE2 domain-containing sensor protein
MRITKIASTGALFAAVHWTPLVPTFLTVLLVVAAALFLRWFVRLPKLAREDVIRLVRALRGS